MWVDRFIPTAGGTVGGVTIAEEKAAQRAEARRRRAALDPAVRAAASGAIAVELATVVGDARVVASYVAIRDEPDLAAFNDGLAAGGRLVLPRIEHGRLVMVPAGPDTPMVVSSFGVPEPAGEPLDPASIDVVVVPGLAFDPSGGRMGYGAGFYDAFLPTVRSDAEVVGVCFEASVFERVVRAPHDVRMGRLVTELGARPAVP